MEKQNINLVTSLPTKQIIYLSFRFIRIIFIFFICSLLIAYLFVMVVSHVGAANADSLKKERAMLNNQISSAMNKMDTFHANAAVLKNITALQSAVQEKERVLALLKTQQNIKFSYYLETLADAIPNTVWLNEIQIIPEEEYVKLVGKTTNASSLPVFIEHLKKTAIYGHYLFKSVDVEKAKENYFQFTITSKIKNEKIEKKSTT